MEILEVGGAGGSASPAPSAALNHNQANHSRPYICQAVHGTCHGNDLPLLYGMTINYHGMAIEDRDTAMGNHGILSGILMALQRVAMSMPRCFGKGSLCFHGMTTDAHGRQWYCPFIVVHVIAATLPWHDNVVPWHIASIGEYAIASHYHDMFMVPLRYAMRLLVRGPSYSRIVPLHAI